MSSILERGYAVIPCSGYQAIGLVKRDKAFVFHSLPVLGWLISDDGHTKHPEGASSAGVPMVHAQPITHFPLETLAIQEPDGLITNREGEKWDSYDKFINAWNRKQRLKNKKG